MSADLQAPPSHPLFVTFVPFALFVFQNEHPPFFNIPQSPPSPHPGKTFEPIRFISNIQSQIDQQGPPQNTLRAFAPFAPLRERLCYLCAFA
jgi:hypothetical protein